MLLSIDQIAKIVDGTCFGDSHLDIDGISSLDKAGPSDITFLFDPRYSKYLPNTNAGVVLLTKENSSNCPTNYIVVTNPYFAYAKISTYFERSPKPNGIHDTASIDKDAVIGKDVSIGANTVIHGGVKVGDNTIIGSNCVIR